MKKRVWALAACMVFSAGIWIRPGVSAQNDKIEPKDRERAKTMLEDMRNALKKNYYDPTFHGLDLEARYQTYRERLEKVTTLGDAFRTIAAFMSGLNDSHTFFIPPRLSYRTEYGYRMQMVGDSCRVASARNLSATTPSQINLPGFRVKQDLASFHRVRQNAFVMIMLGNLLSWPERPSLQPGNLAWGCRHSRSRVTPQSLLPTACSKSP